MAKRVLEEFGNANVDPLARHDSLAEEKRRKDKHDSESKIYKNSGRPVHEEKEIANKDLRKENRAPKKARKLQGNKSNGSKSTAENVRLQEVKQGRKQLPQNIADSKLVQLVRSHDNSIPDGSRPSYIENATLRALEQTVIDRFVTENFISIEDPKSTTESLRPIIEFSYLPTTEPAYQVPFKTFKAPTPIQAAAWPFLLAGRDVIGIAETGSGKTMAFAIPCVRYITSLSKSFVGIKAVIVSPTRELAMQSYEQITELATLAGMHTACVYGGVPKDEQRKALKQADVIVATPGRLNDLINEGCANLSNVGYVVLDEADRMLDTGFEEEIRKIVNTTLPMGKRQTLMFTATWPKSVRTLAATFMTSPVKVAIGDNPSGDLRANARIVQKIEVVDPRNKEYRLLQLLKQYQSGSQKDDRILVFCLYKKEATRIENFLRSKGIRVAGIHGDLGQEQRTRSLAAFKKGSTPVLVATDVAARGLDIPAVKLVINCTFPLTAEDYVHRIGRTGRAGKDGLAITLFTEHDKAHSGA